MKKTYLLLLLPLLLLSCSKKGTEGGTGEEEMFVTLTADRNEVKLAEDVIFSVTYGTADVTAEAVIRDLESGEALDAHIFEAKATGTYRFAAEYDGKTSNTVNISVLRQGVAGLSLESDMGTYRYGTDEQIVFKVYYNNVDVTSAAGLVYDGTGEAVDLQGNSYVFPIGDNTGELSFTTTYNGISKTLAIPRAGFFKKALFFRFTGTWCQYCYPFSNFVATVESDERYAGRIAHLAVHYDDPMQIDACAELVEKFKITGFPRAIWDYYRVMMNTDVAGIISSLDGLLRNNPATAGIAIATAIEGNSVKVTVRTAVTRAGDYYLGVALAESGITGYPQSTPDRITDASYEHNNVLRAYATPIDGDSLGSLASGAIVTKEYSVSLAESDPDKSRIIVYLNKSDGTALQTDNSASIPVGETAGFEYEE